MITKGFTAVADFTECVLLIGMIDRLYGTYQKTFAWRLQGAGVDELQMVQ